MLSESSTNAAGGTLQTSYICFRLPQPGHLASLCAKCLFHTGISVSLGNHFLRYDWTFEQLLTYLRHHWRD